jgi:hypothetical protein
MGCGASAKTPEGVFTEDFQGSSLSNGMQWSEVVAFGGSGLSFYAFRADGSHEILESSSQMSLWRQMQSFGPLGLALPDSRVISFGFSCPTVLDTEKQTVTFLGQSSWNQAKAVARPLSSSDTVVLFHTEGVFSLNTNDGSYTKLSEECWTLLKALVVDPAQDIAYAFHDNGLFKVDLTTGSSQQLNNEDWSQTQCAVWTSTDILLLHADGIYRVDVETGKSRKVHSDRWSLASMAIDVGDGTALVFHSSGLYKLSLSTATCTKVEEANSCHLNRPWVMRPETRCANIEHRPNAGLPLLLGTSLVDSSIASPAKGSTASALGGA